MKARPLLLGVAVALLGVVLQILYMQRFEEEASGGAKVDVLVAAQPIERGSVITAEQLGVRSIPQAYVDDRAIRAADRGKLLNLRTVTKVPVLQTLVWTDVVATSDEHRDLSSLVQPGNRAMPIRVAHDEVLQLIRPGDFVDLLSVDGEGRTASVLLQRVLVLAAGLDTSVERSTERSPVTRSSLLTVSVTLQEAQLLSLAMTIGRVSAIVRSNNDPRTQEVPPDVSRAELFDTAARQAVQSQRRTRPVRLERGINQ